MSLLSALLAITFLGAGFVPLLYRCVPKLAAWLSPIPALFVFVAFCAQFKTKPAGTFLMESNSWVPEIGLSWSLGLDSFRLLFALLITGIGFLVLLYGGHYCSGRAYGPRMLTFLYLFMGSMLGLVLSQNLLLVVIFWELTSLTSFFLIGLRFEDFYAVKSAQRALLTTGFGGLFLLAGMIGLGQSFGTYEFPQIMAMGHANPIPGWAIVSILIGCLTKSAQFPFHAWLPGAMVAPTPVSAYLHSATMVKAGVFLLAVLSPILGNTFYWSPILIGAGTATVFISTGALLKHDFKQAMAFSTVGVLGLMVMLIGIGTPQAMYALSALIVTHALYKATLFLSSGTIDRQMRTRDMTSLAETGVALPWTRFAVGVACLSMGGVPLFLGFATKEYIYKTWLSSPVAWWSAIGFLSSGVLTAAIAWRTFSSVVLPKSTQRAELKPEIRPMQLPILVLAIAGLVAGIAVPLVVRILPAATDAAVPELKWWYGFDVVLAISLSSIAVGAVVAKLIKPHVSTQEDREFLDSVFFGIHRVSRNMVRVLQTGHLRRYIQLTLISVLVLVGIGIWRVGGLRFNAGDVEIQAHELIVTLAIVAGAIGAVVASNRLRAIVSLGVVGFGIAAVYIMFGAPDLAMTQIFVEILTVILFVLIFYHMPKFSRLSSLLGRRFDAVLACGVGAMMTVLTIVAANQEHKESIANWHAENALVQGQGRNVVNVMLVDFRGLDTMGEITVLGIAAIGVYAILKLKPRKKEESS
ncbi:MAG: DUF4040 domain-containing protein [Fimbriimonadaceae bacterium]|nr:DUF4040 domain-containing protein [Fimbriimonadaceae bacterium]